MTKITIEVDGGTVQPTGASPPGPSETTASARPASMPGVNPPPEVLAQAAAIGAINGGPAPTLSSIAQSSAPIASSVAGTGSTQHDAASAGAAPEHLFGTQQ